MTGINNIKIERWNISNDNLRTIQESIAALESSEADLEFSNDLIEFLQQKYEGTIYIAKTTATLIGNADIVAYLLVEGKVDSKSKATIRGLYTCTAFRGQKIGTQLVQRCIQDYQRDIFINIRRGVESFYESLGFSILEPRRDLPELTRGVHYRSPRQNIQVFHESPIKLFKRSSRYNDYLYILQYCLDNEEYKKYVISEIKTGKMVIFDNSAFEYGLDLPSDDVFASNVKYLSSFAPDKSKFYFIINDYLNEQEKTLVSATKWLLNYGNLGCKIIGSIQGKTMQELIECYKIMSECPNIDKLAITFDSEAYDRMFSDIDNKLLRWSRGRQYLIRRLVEEGLWNFNKPHHLLGASYVNEFNNPLYKKLTIESIDTSNPVVCALHNIKYDEKFGNTSKPSTKLCDLLHADVTEEQEKILDFNIQVFKNIIKS